MCNKLNVCLIKPDLCLYFKRRNLKEYLQNINH